VQKRGNNKAIPLSLLKRNNFFSGKILTIEDFQAEQNYFINKQRLINRMLFGKGVVSGLEVTANKSAGIIHLNEGFALDGYGREIVLPTQLVCNLNQKYTAKEVGKTRDLFVWIRYDENMTDPVPAIGDAGTSFNMITEGSKMEVDWAPPESSSIDKIFLAKITVETNGDKIYISKIDNSAMVNGVSLRKVAISSQKLWESKNMRMKSAQDRGFNSHPQP
jgi:hypothetical protein